VDSRIALPKGTLLVGDYRIERLLASGGFGITYEAEETKLGTRVAIKEYYPADFGQRDVSLRVRPLSERQTATFEWGRKSFLDEARTLARFRHPSIVRITRVFEAYATAYMVMDFEEGQSFEDWLKRLERPPTQEELDRVAGPVLDALELMHAQSFLHRDIAPDNIIVRADGTPVLLDFGAARRALAEKSRVLTGIVKMGYSPFEQYATDSRLQGPWTDLYALGATLYRAVTGKVPEEATLRMADDRMAPAVEAAAGVYRPGFLTAIDASLKTRHSERPQSVAALRPMLLAPAQKATAPRVAIRKMGTTNLMRASPLQSAKAWWAVAAAIAVVAGGAFGGLQYTRWDAGERARAEADAKRNRGRLSDAAEGWATVKDTRSIPALAAFVARFRDTLYADLARKRITELETPSQASANRPRTGAVKLPSIRDNYIVMQEYAAIGKSIDWRRNLDLESCSQLCDNNASCVGYQFSATSSYCNILSSWSNAVVSPGAISAKKRLPSPANIEPPRDTLPVMPR